MKRRSLWSWLLLLVSVSGQGREGPWFVVEPPRRMDFSNSTGARLECSAQATPSPLLHWLLGDGRRVGDVPGLRELYPNGTLVFPPFPGERYRQDVHNGVYRCQATNPAGTILSRDVNLRAVVKQKYEVQVYDEYVISGSTAVLNCQVPTYVAEFIIVTSWIQDGVVNIYPNTDTGGKFSVMTNGDLYIYNVGPNDGYKKYGCRTVHKLTGDVQTSSYPGRIIITEPKGGVQPRLRVDKHSRKQIKVGEDVVMSCIAQGYPIPTYTWYKEEDGTARAVAGSERMTIEKGLLKIIKAREEDSGRYLCTANNTIGVEEVQLNLVVTALLTVHVQPASRTVEVGEEATLRCSVTGFPVGRISWLRDGRPLPPDSRYRLSPDSRRLTVSPLFKDDRGVYQCFAFNEWDAAQASAQLRFGDASPELAYSFSEQTLQPGPPVSLKCVATGNPPPQFTWTLDGFPIPDSSRFLVGQYVTVHDEVVSHVNISSIKEEDGGEFTCIAKNAVARISHSARINVYGLPLIRLMPKVSAVAGTDLIIKCPVGGYPIEIITWEREGSILPVNRRQRVYANGTLVIEQAQKPVDAGTYTCQAQNRQKHTARRDVEVQVLLPPKILPIQAMTNLLREGMRAAISCQILEGDLPLTFRWERDGSSELGVGATVRRLDEYSTALVIDKITAAHSANYTCIVQNVAGSERFTVPLTVNVPPRWTVEPVDTSVALGFDVTLHCQASGYPQPTIIWRKAVGDHPTEYKDFLYEPNVNFYQNGSLEFLHINKESEGYYLCEAKNGIADGLSKVIFLKVNSPAYFPQKAKQVHVEKGSQAHLQCTALGDNPIVIFWKIGSQRVGEDFDPRYSIREQLLDEGMVSELGITHVFRHDTGTLTCYASNAYGHDEMVMHLVIQEAPELPKNIRVNDQQSRSLQLSWTQPFTGNSAITSYVIQYKLVSEPWDAQPSKVVVPGTQTVATVTNLHPASSYHFRILAENKLGLSEPSEVIQVTTQEEVPTGAPRNVQVEAKSSTELSVMWEAPPKDQWNGNLLGYYVGYSEISSVTPATVTISQHLSLKTVEVGSQYEGHTVLDGLAMFTSYAISVQAFNSRGAGPNSENVVARTKEGVPTLPPEKVDCSTSSSTSLQVWWEPPSTEGRNGHLQGYKVNYYPCEDWYESADFETKEAIVSRTTLSALQKFTNYSISVLAYTRSGDGVVSDPVFCRTAEDVPTKPAGIKVAMSGPSKILVSWLPPEHSNGVLVGYTLYMGTIEGGKEDGTHKRVLSPVTEAHETIQLQEGVTYEFWVTSSTRVGEGPSTSVITILPTKKIPAKIMSFSRLIVTPWKQNVTLICRTVGVPGPKLVWKFQSKQLDGSNSRYQMKKDGTLSIREIQHSDRGNYSCHAENIEGTDTIIYKIVVRVPPEPPHLSVMSSDTDSLHLKWTTKGNYEIPILGYIINYKRDHGDWEELQISAKEDAHILQNLWCGTRYQLYITAFNKIGTGLPCDIVNAYTKGTAPIKPGAAQLLTVNSTAVTVWLDAWGDGGCAVLYFIVEYRDESRTDWILVSNHVQASDRVHTISELSPATRYLLRVTAHNNAGSSVATYNFTTLSLDGSVIIPKIFPPVQSSSDPPIYKHLKTIISIIFILVTLVLMGGIGFYVHKKRQQLAFGMGESSSVAQMQNQQNRDQQYAVHGVQSHQALSIDSTTYKTDSTEYIEDICPYATFQLSKPPYTESTFSGNVYSGPYHSVRGSFVYHDLPSAGDTYKPRHSKEPEYTKVRRKTGRLRDPHSESQESDNLGSTDSEVKKILTLHLPISEYDTHGSDSEGDGAHVTTASQELVSFRHRIARDVPKGGGEESSSSSERSPRKLCPPVRKMKGKLPSGKKPGKSSSGYSSHTEETSFSFSDRINPPSRFSDSQCHTRDLNESECDLAKIGVRRSSRNSIGVPYRLSRESTFQIDV